MMLSAFGMRLFVFLCRRNGVEEVMKRNISFNTISTRRKFAEIMVNKYKSERVLQLGPDLACLEWLMNCGATCVTMSEGVKITSQRQMRDYIRGIGVDVKRISAPATELVDQFSSKRLMQKTMRSDVAYLERWADVAPHYIAEVDASDAAVADEGFHYFAECRQIKTLKLNHCDYFGDAGLRVLSSGRPGRTLIDLEIVMNPHITDGALQIFAGMRALRRAHLYFLPYVTRREQFLRQMRVALPHCHVTFPATNVIGYGYEEAKKY